MLIFLAALILIFVLLACWLLTVIGLPGNWLMVTAATLYAILLPAGSRGTLSWKLVAGLVVLALLGEAVEVLAGALGVRRAGGSKRGAVLALLGSIVGGLVGLVVGLPIPVIGSMAAALLFGGLGALAGAIVGETWAGRNLDASWRVGKLAFVARLVGTLSKVVLGAVMVAVAVVALLL